MNCSRPPPEPTGSYAIVTSGLASWNPAIHACWAASCALEPAPVRLPESSLAAGVLLLPPAAAGAGSSLSFEAPHALTPSASAATSAATNRVVFIDCSFSCLDRRGPSQALGAHLLPTCSRAVKNL